MSEPVTSASSQEMVTFLSNNSLQHFEGLFLEHLVEYKDLLVMNHSDLLGMGIRKFADRKQILGQTKTKTSQGSEDSSGNEL